MTVKNMPFVLEEEPYKDLKLDIPVMKKRPWP